MGEVTARTEKGNNSQILLDLTKTAFSLSAKTVTCAYHLSKKACQMIRNNVYIDRQHLEHLLQLMKRTGCYIKDEVLIDLKPYLNSKTVYIALKEIHKQALLETNRYCLVDHTLLDYICHISADDHHTCYTKRDASSRHIFQMNITGAILWELLQEKVYKDDFTHWQALSDDLKMMRKWNNRVNERDLINKIGSQDNWDIFADRALSEDELCHYVQTKDQESDLMDGETYNVEDNSDENEEEFDDLRITKSSYLDNAPQGYEGSPVKFENKEKKLKQKKHGLLNPIRKLFRLNKNEKHVSGISEDVERPTEIKNNFKDRKLQRRNIHSGTTNGNRKRRRNKDCDTEECNRYSNDCSHDITGQGRDLRTRDLQGQRKNAAGDRDEGLVIQIPINVQKIVLVKDSRKITIEV